MRRIVLFAEDWGHEEFLGNLVLRVAHENGTVVSLVPRNVSGGHGQVISEFKAYLRGLRRGEEPLPDLLIVATDANCKGYAERRREAEDANERYKDITIYAIPDPHVERWLLLDSSAFKSVFGKGCDAPDQKCKRDRYKTLLREAIRQAGVIPPLGGMEYAEDIVNAMDLQRMEKANASLGKFLKDLGGKFREWTKG